MTDPQRIEALDPASEAPDGVVEDVGVGSSNTRRTYDSSWRRFESWCEAEGCNSLPATPQTVARYVTAAARERDGEGYRYKSSTFSVWMASIGDRHAGAGYAHPGADPLVAKALREIRRRRVADGELVRKAAPLVLEGLQTVVTSIDEDARGWVAQVAARRDIALLVIGFSGALRRTELARLQVGDVAPVVNAAGDWLGVHLRGLHASADEGEYVYLPRGRSSGRWCPWCAYLRWLAVVTAYDTAVDRMERSAQRRERAGALVDWRAVADMAADEGTLAVTRLVRGDGDLDQHVCAGPWPRVSRGRVPLFRSLRNGTPREKRALTAGSIARMLHRRAAQAGLDPDTVELLSGHALRAGAATEAFDRGASLEEVMSLTRLKSMAVRRYDRTARFENNAAAHLGL